MNEFSEVARILRVEPWGNDETAEPGNFKRPFMTLDAAISTYESGDSIRVGLGSYEVTQNLIGYTLDLHPLAVMNIPGNTVVFDDSSGPVFKTLRGGIFVKSGTGPIVNLVDPGSELQILDMELRKAGSCINHTDGRLMIDRSKIYNQTGAQAGAMRLLSANGSVIIARTLMYAGALSSTCIFASDPRNAIIYESAANKALSGVVTNLFADGLTVDEDMELPLIV